MTYFIDTNGVVHFVNPVKEVTPNPVEETGAYSEEQATVLFDKYGIAS